MPVAQAVLSLFLTFFTHRFRFFLSWMRLHLANGCLAVGLVLALAGPAPGAEDRLVRKPEGRLQARHVGCDQGAQRGVRNAGVDARVPRFGAPLAPARDSDQPVSAGRHRRLQRPAAVARAGVDPAVLEARAYHRVAIELARVVARAGAVVDHVHRRRLERVRCPAELAGVPPAADVNGAPGCPERRLVSACDLDLRLRRCRGEHQIADIELGHLGCEVRVVVHPEGDAGDGAASPSTERRAAEDHVDVVRVDPRGPVPTWVADAAAHHAVGIAVEDAVGGRDHDPRGEQGPAAEVLPLSAVLEGCLPRVLGDRGVVAADDLGLHRPVALSVCARRHERHQRRQRDRTGPSSPSPHQPN